MHMTLPTGLRLKIIGDPHLGRNFSVGCPPERRGEREESQFNQLSLMLSDKDCDVNIMMGDIFDKFIVDPSIVMKTYAAYANAAVANPNVDFILIRGNHDVSRDMMKFSSFDLLAHMLRAHHNIIVVNEMGLYSSRDMSSSLLFCGYNPFYTTEEMLEDLGAAEMGFFDAVFGHWDIESFGGDDHNLCPYQYLGLLTDTVVTGHIHTPSKFYINVEDGQKIPEELIHKYEYLKVIVTGSMQPYSHGEDPNELIYVTRTLEEYEQEVAKDKAAFHDKCLRLDIKPDEDLPDNIDCLQFSYRVVRDKEDDEVIEVKLEDFDFKDLFYKSLQAHDVETDYIDEIWSTYQELSSDVE